MPVSIIASSLSGEVRIEAQLKADDSVSFRMYYLNTKQKGFDLDDEPKQNFSITGAQRLFY